MHKKGAHHKKSGSKMAVKEPIASAGHAHSSHSKGHKAHHGKKHHFKHD